MSSVSTALQFLSVNHTSIYKNLEPNVSKNVKFLGEISINWPSDLLGTTNTAL